MTEFNMPSSLSYSYNMAELYKKASSIDPIKKAQAKQLLNSKALKFNSSAQLDKLI